MFFLSSGVKGLKGDSRMTGCLSDTASYWSTEIVPIMNSVQCGVFRTFFRPWKLAPWHFRWNASIWVTWSDMSHVCKLWWRKGQWVRFWTLRLPNISHVWPRFPIHFPKLKQSNYRAWNLGVVTQETRKKTTRSIPEEVGERWSTFVTQTWTDLFPDFVFATPFCCMFS